MSQQSDAKKAQDYVDKHQPGVCGRCVHMTRESVLPAWMAEQNKVVSDKWNVATYGVEKNRRCTIGGFAVKKMGSCNRFKATS